MTTCARSGRCSRRRQDVSAHGLSPGRDLPVRSLAAARGDPGRARPDAPRLGCGRVPGLLARGRRRAGLLHADRGPAGRDRRLPVSGSAALPETLVWDRQAGHPRPRRPPVARRSRRFCGQLRVGWRFCEAADPQAKGAVERLQGYVETNFEPGRVFANELDFQDQLDGWFDKVNARTHKTLRARPVDRLVEELEVMAPLPSAMPDTRSALGARGSRRTRYLRVDTNDYCARSRRWSAAASRSGRPARGHWRSRWTPARSPAATRAPSPGTARSPRSSTPAR